MLYVDLDTGTILNGPIAAVSQVPADLTDSEAIAYATEHGRILA